jgi:hypothetical protein
MIDDASNEMPYAQLYPQDSLFANMGVLRGTIEAKGPFMALYVDKASHFTTTRQGGLHYQVALEQNDTQIERALGELGINLILANSPQAKGRIEVTFRFFQDRFIKELRLAGITTYDQLIAIFSKPSYPGIIVATPIRPNRSICPCPRTKTST